MSAALYVWDTVWEDMNPLWQQFTLVGLKQVLVADRVYALKSRVNGSPK